MKKPYRDQYGRFAKRPLTKKRKKHVQKIPSHRLSLVPVRKPRPKRLSPLRPVTTKQTTPQRKKEKAPSRKRLPETKPKKIKEWDTRPMGDILNSYIEELDLDEDSIGDYRDPFQHLYEMLRSKKYRHSSLLVMDEKLIPWKSKPPRMQIWFLVHYHHEGRYNIEFRTWENGDNVSLKEFVSYIHQYFIADQQASFEREAESSYKNREAIHMIALNPIFVKAPTRKRKPRQGWKFNAPSTYKKNPPQGWKKRT